MKKMIWSDHVGSEEVLCRVKERNIQHTIKRWESNCIGHILCRDCILIRVTE